MNGSRPPMSITSLVAWLVKLSGRQADPRDRPERVDSGLTVWIRADAAANWFYRPIPGADGAEMIAMYGRSRPALN
jgi:hypothetical protein